jgi:hypothetical protein
VILGKKFSTGMVGDASIVAGAIKSRSITSAGEVSWERTVRKTSSFSPAGVTGSTAGSRSELCRNRRAEIRLGEPLDIHARGTGLVRTTARLADVCWALYLEALAFFDLMGRLSFFLASNALYHHRVSRRSSAVNFRPNWRSNCAIRASRFGMGFIHGSSKNDGWRKSCTRISNLFPLRIALLVMKIEELGTEVLPASFCHHLNLLECRPRNIGSGVEFVILTIGNYSCAWLPPSDALCRVLN